jgi:hypothetical protein
LKRRVLVDDILLSIGKHTFNERLFMPKEKKKKDKENNER